MKIRLNWKGNIALIILSFMVMFAVASFAQTGATTTAPTVAAPTGIAAWVKTQGGLVAAVGVIMGCLNLILSSFAQICSKLQVAEPVWAQNIGKFAGTIVAWFSANIPTPAPQVQAALTANAASTITGTQASG